MSRSTTAVDVRPSHAMRCPMTSRVAVLRLSTRSPTAGVRVNARRTKRFGSRCGGSPTVMANQLASATSPYLLQHQDNPVDWQPWSTAAFEEAKRRDVPVLLSVGYAACHWCHVM